MATTKRVAAYIATGDVEGLAKKRERARRAMKAWRAKDGDRARAWDRARYKRDRAKRVIANRRTHLQRKFGLTLEQYESMLSAQGGVCALCARPPQRVRLHVDHDHATGQIRALLCGVCNTMLGRVEAIGLTAIALYVGRPARSSAA